MIGDLARALLLEDKAVEHREEVRKRQRARLEELRAAVEKARTRLDAHWMPAEEPGRRVRGVPSPTGLFRMYVAFSGLYVLLHLTVLPYADWTPAGWACPLVCQGCSASARSIHVQGGNGDSEVDGVAVCRNPFIDVDRISVDEMLGAAHSRLAPYRLSGTIIVLVECSLWLAIIMPLMSLWVRRNGRRLRADLEVALNHGARMRS